MTFIIHFCLWITVALTLAWCARISRLANVRQAIATKTSGLFAQGDSAAIAVASFLITASGLYAVGFSPYFAAAASIFAAAAIPRQISLRRKKTFREEFNNSLVEALTTIESALKAGLTIKQSLELTLNSCPKVFCDEIERALKEYRLGLSLDEALDGVRKRVGTDEANISFGAMIIAHQLGGNLPATLQRISQTIRDRQRVTGKLKALTAQGRTQGWLVCSAPIVIGVLTSMWDPSKMALLTGTTTGQVLLCLAATLEVMGILITKKIMQFEA